MEQLPNHLNRPTITLALIVKNEEKNLPRLLESVDGCFDEIVLVDTGSTDKTVEIATAKGCVISHFEWVDDFSKARNFAFSQATKDFVFWMDADDVLSDKEAFKKWRDHAMAFVDCWFATYHYALDKNGNPVVSFIRERCFKRSLKPLWRYPLHEGIIPEPHWSKNYATPWSIKHLRDEKDIEQDRSRNITLLEKFATSNEIDSRMQFYYGKELYEIGRAPEAVPVFEKALTLNLEPHDRILSLQYGAYAAISCFEATSEPTRKHQYFTKAMDLAHQGIKLQPNRAEFYVLIGDAYIRTGNLQLAVPYFAAAKACLKNFDTPYEGAIYSFKNLYGEAPSIQLAKVYTHLGLLDKAKKECLECIEAFNNEEAKQVLSEVERVSSITRIKNNQTQTDDIVFTTPPQNAYPFDEEMYKEKPLGGSETALVQMARLLKEKTGRRVIVFNQREKDLISSSGVEYISNGRVTEYFSQFKPGVHIAWRHNIKLTDAKTYLWCHDLFTPGVEGKHNFDQFLALSKFHKNYTMGLQGVPEEKIIVTRNGIDPEKFKFEKPAKNPNKVVWMSSPDRGLDRAMMILDKAREKNPDIELHVYYGIENLYKYGPHMSALADQLKEMMKQRSYVKYHGFTEQTKMMKEVSDASIWCHPNNFIETFCITALECLANGIFPVVRRLGALQDTLHEAEEKGHAVLLDYAWDDEASLQKHADAICEAIEAKRWENISFDIEKHSWDSVANEWIQFMQLEKKKPDEVAV